MFEDIFVADKGKEINVSWQQVIHARNYIMFMVTLYNACRSSNLINMTLYDFNMATTHEDFPNAKVVKSKRYKTSMLYGTKMVVFNEALHRHTELYIKHLRPLIISDDGFDDKERFLFTSSKASKSTKTTAMTQSLVSNSLTSTFREAEVYKDEEKYNRVSPSRIRASVATELAGLGDENLTTMAHVFMKHREETCKRFYVQHWANREALRISMSCYDRFSVTISEKVKKEAVELRKSYEEIQNPTKPLLKSWYYKLAQAIKVGFGEVFEDENLTKELEILGELELPVGKKILNKMNIYFHLVCLTFSINFNSIK